MIMYLIKQTPQNPTIPFYIDDLLDFSTIFFKFIIATPSPIILENTCHVNTI